MMRHHDDRGAKVSLPFAHTHMHVPQIHTTSSYRFVSIYFLFSLLLMLSQPNRCRCRHHRHCPQSRALLIFMMSFLSHSYCSFASSFSLFHFTFVEIKISDCVRFNVAQFLNFIHLANFFLFALTHFVPSMVVCASIKLVSVPF